MSNFYKNLILLGFGLGVSLLLAEGVLRIFNPFDVRLRGNEILLPRNREYVIQNSKIPKLDPVITHRKNSIGFRGAEPPEDFDRALSLVAVGGSTTEEYYLSDEKTWPALIQKKLANHFNDLWINNAGFDGHSTFGHQMLIDQVLADLHPDVLLFLIGLNDIERSDLNEGYDNGFAKNHYLNGLDYVTKKSELANLLANLARVWQAQRIGVAHSSIDLSTLERIDVEEEEMQRVLEEQRPYLEAYRQRVLRLIELTRAAGSEPLFLTQPVLWGEGIDPTTKQELTRIKIKSGRHAKLFWLILQQYNQVTKEVGEQNNVLVIDLANEMPKDSKYYYDGYHFTNEGAEKVAEIVAPRIKTFLEKMNATKGTQK